MVNENQKKAIEKIEGPVLVLAGPGSGKTFVTINRIYNMVANHNINPENILVITFTRKASLEMKERFEKLIKEKNISGLMTKPKFGTFHSIFFEILRESFGYNDESVISDKEKTEYLKKVLLEAVVSKKYKFRNIKNKSDVNEILVNNILRDINDEKIKKEKGEKFRPKYLSRKIYERVRDDYNDRLYKEKKLDFYDMINICFNKLKEDKNVLSFYQDKYKYILIDEFQDINKDQYNIIKLLSKTKNVFAVGDDDQSIYMFRGSKPSIIKDFKRDYKNHILIKLNQNYRSAKLIVRFSKKIIDKNKNRVKKELKSERNIRGRVLVKSFDNSKNENDYIIKNIKDKLKEGYRYSDIALLYRTNILSRSIITALKAYNIPFEVKTEVDNIDLENADDKVRLMTFHSSKGLEFREVIILDANDGLIPHKKSLDQMDIETERRLFYVACTRAKDDLNIYFTKERFGKSFKPSRFILEGIRR